MRERLREKHHFNNIVCVSVYKNNNSELAEIKLDLS